MFKMIDDIATAAIPFVLGAIFLTMFGFALYENEQGRMNRPVLINCEEIATGKLYEARTYGNVRNYYTPEKAILNGKVGMTYFLFGEPLIAWRKHYGLVDWTLENGRMTTFTFRDKNGDRVFRYIPIEERVQMPFHKVREHNGE